MGAGENRGSAAGPETEARIGVQPLPRRAPLAGAQIAVPIANQRGNQEGLSVKCEEQRMWLLELARSGAAAGPETEAHLPMCEECSRFLEEQLALGAALAHVAEENAAAAVPEGVEAHVFAELAPRRSWRPLAAAALAATLAAGVFVARAPAPPAHARAEPFLAIPFVAPLAPYERAEVQRMDLPVAALVAAGFEVHLPDTAGTVKADVLVGQDGRAHAIRLISEVRQ
jgi:hypothetical protein